MTPEEEMQIAGDMEVRQAQLGIDAEVFLRSNLGQYMMERANLEIEEVTMELVNASPSDLETNTTCRNRIGVCNAFKVWLREVVHTGRVAENAILESDALD